MIQSATVVVCVERGILIGDGHGQVRMQDVVVGKFTAIRVHPESIPAIRAPDQVSLSALGRQFHRSINHIMTVGPKITSTALT
jgi:hypothetical protein